MGQDTLSGFPFRIALGQVNIHEDIKGIDQDVAAAGTRISKVSVFDTIER